jgi:hypothetical protein
MCMYVCVYKPRREFKNVIRIYFFFFFFERDPDFRYVDLTTIVNNGLLLSNNDTIHVQNIMEQHIENSSGEFVSVIIYIYIIK